MITVASEENQNGVDLFVGFSSRCDPFLLLTWLLRRQNLKIGKLPANEFCNSSQNIYDLLVLHICYSKTHHKRIIFLILINDINTIIVMKLCQIKQ